MTAAAVNIAVVGASGMLGAAVLEALAERPFAFAQVHALGGPSSAGGEVDFGHRQLPVALASGFDYRQVQLVLMTAPAATVAELLPAVLQAGCAVVDASGALASDPAALMWGRTGARPDTPRVVLPQPGVSQAMAVLAPLANAGALRAASIVELRAVSGRGTAAVGELGRQTADVLNFRSWSPQAYPQQIAFNLLAGMGSAGEEHQAIAQLQALLPNLVIELTQIEVPVFYGFGQVLRLQFAEAITVDQVRSLLQSVRGLQWGDDGGDDAPTPVTHASGSDVIFLSRLRSSPTGDAVQLWSVADNVRSGGARPMIDAARLLVEEYL